VVHSGTYLGTGAELLRHRAGNASPEDLKKYLAATPEVPPMPGDEIDPSRRLADEPEPIMPPRTDTQHAALSVKRERAKGADLDFRIAQGPAFTAGSSPWD